MTLKKEKRKRKRNMQRFSSLKMGAYLLIDGICSSGGGEQSVS